MKRFELSGVVSRFLFLVLTISILAVTVSALEYPSADLATEAWTLARGMTLENGVLRMEGAPGEYRKAKLLIPSSSVGKGRFFITANIRTENVRQGKKGYEKPKLKMYYEGRPETRRASLFPQGTLKAWTVHGLDYQAKKGQEGNLVLEISMESCSGVAYVKDVVITNKRPKAEQFFPFDIPENPVCKLDIDTSSARDFNNDLLGLNAHCMGSNKLLRYDDERIQKLIGKIKVPVLRFPGGTVANWYDYKTDMWAITPNIHPKTHLRSRIDEAIAEGRRFYFNEHLAMSKKYGFKTTMVINVLHDSPERCAARVKDRMDRGLVFPWIELGNENYASPGQQSAEVDSVEKYIAKGKAVTAAIKAVNPNVMVAVNIHMPDDKHWGLPISKENFYDAVVMHPYSSAGRGAIHFGAATMQLGLTAYTQLGPKFDEYRKIYGDKPLLLTEWGVLGGSGNIRNHLAALGTADMFFRIIKEWENGPVKNACIHVFSDGYMGLYDIDRDTNVLYKRAYGVAYDLMVRAFLGNQILAGESASSILDQGVGLHAIMARATRNKSGKVEVFAVNKLPVPAPLELSLDGKAYVGKYSLKAFSDMDLHTQKRFGIDEDPCKTTTGNGTTVMLPPYSVNLVTLR